jgi:hypothetical protein
MRWWTEASLARIAASIAGLGGGAIVAAVRDPVAAADHRRRSDESRTGRYMATRAMRGDVFSSPLYSSLGRLAVEDGPILEARSSADARPNR